MGYWAAVAVGVGAAAASAAGSALSGSGGGGTVNTQPPKWANAFAWPGWLAEMGRLYPDYQVKKNEKGEIIGFDEGKPAAYPGTPQPVAPIDPWTQQGWDYLAGRANQGDPYGASSNFMLQGTLGDQYLNNWNQSASDPRRNPALNPALNPSMRLSTATPGSPTVEGNPNSDAWWLQPDAPTAANLSSNPYSAQGYNLGTLRGQNLGRDYGALEAAYGIGPAGQDLLGQVRQINPGELGRVGNLPQVGGAGGAAAAEVLNLEDPTAVLNPARKKLMEQTLRGISDNYRDAVAPSTAGKFARAGIFGSSAHGDTEAQERYSMGRTLDEAGVSLADKFYSEDLNAKLAHARNLIAERDPRLSYMASIHGTDVSASTQAGIANQNASLQGQIANQNTALSAARANLDAEMARRTLGMNDLSSRRNLATDYEKQTRALDSQNRQVDLTDLMSQRDTRRGYDTIWQDYVTKGQDRDNTARMQTKSLANANLQDWLGYVNNQEQRSLQDNLNLRDNTRGYIADQTRLYDSERARQMQGLTMLPMMRGERNAPGMQLAALGNERRAMITQPFADSIWNYQQQANVEWPFRRDSYLSKTMGEYLGATGAQVVSNSSPSTSAGQYVGIGLNALSQGVGAYQGYGAANPAASSTPYGAIGQNANGSYIYG